MKRCLNPLITAKLLDAPESLPTPLSGDDEVDDHDKRDDDHADNDFPYDVPNVLTRHSVTPGSFKGWSIPFQRTPLK